MKVNDILVGHGRDYKQLTKKLLRQADAAALIPSSDTLIGIKPNLLGPIPASEGATTHPEVAAGIIEYLQEAGFSKIVLLESSWVGDRTSDSLLVTGFDLLAADYDVPFWDLQEDGSAAVDCAGMELNVCERALQVEFLINVPVLKGHCQTRMTCALKNMKGLLPASEKRRFHRMGLHEPIGHLSAGIRQGLIVVDCICPDLTFEDGGHPVQMDRIMIARDPVLCDAYGASLLGLTLDEVAYIGQARECGIGCDDITQAEVQVYESLSGDDGGGLQKSRDVQNTPETWGGNGGWRRILEIEESVNSVDTCSACYASLLPALVKLDEEGILDKIPGQICIGQGYKGQTGELGVGSCTRLFSCSLPGCPPSSDRVEDWLRELVK